MDCPLEPWTQIAAERSITASMRGFRAERHPEPGAVCIKREVTRGPGTRTRPHDLAPDEVDDGDRTPLRLADERDTLGGVHRRVPRLAEP